MKKRYKTEFHVHTKYSSDSILTFSMLLLISKLKKIDTLVITDHNEIIGAKKCKEKFKKHNINVIIGEEIFTKDGEIIGINLNKKIIPGLSATETIKEIKKQHGLVYVPHPYDEKRYKTVLKEKCIEKNKNNIDFIEVHNGRNILKKFSVKQQEIARKYNLCEIIGSDAHTFFEIGRNVVLTDKKINENNILINYNNVIFIKKNCINFSHFCTKIARVIKILKRGDLNGFCGIINKRLKGKK